MSCILEKKKKELEKQHEEVRRRLEEERSQSSVQYQRQFNDKCSLLEAQLAKNPASFLDSVAPLHRHQSERKQSTHL